MNLEQSSTSPSLAFSQPTAILVEDEPSLCHALTSMLRGAGFNVLPCSCADEAIAFLQASEKSVSLLLTDILLPGINGHDLAKAIQAQVPDIHIIYMSGFSAGYLSDSALKEPHTAFLQKPFNRARLFAAISEVSSDSTPVHQ